MNDSLYRVAGWSCPLASFEGLTMQSCEGGELQQHDGWEAEEAHLGVLGGRAWLWAEPSSLYIRVTIFITAGPDVRATTKPAPSSHRRVIARLLPPHPRRRSLGAPSSGAERAGCGKCWPPSACQTARKCGWRLGGQTSDNISAMVPSSRAGSNTCLQVTCE